MVCTDVGNSLVYGRDYIVLNDSEPCDSLRAFTAVADAAYIAAIFAWGRAYEHGRGAYADMDEACVETAKGLGIAM